MGFGYYCSLLSCSFICLFAFLFAEVRSSRASSSDLEDRRLVTFGELHVTAHPPNSPGQHVDLPEEASKQASLRFGT